jgi:hypothetical protein
MRQEVRAKYPDLKNTELSSMLAVMWRDATDEVKQPHLEREAGERERYHEKMVVWKQDAEARAEQEKMQKLAMQEVSECVVGRVWKELRRRGRLWCSVVPCYYMRLVWVPLSFLRSPSPPRPSSLMTDH